MLEQIFNAQKKILLENSVDFFEFPNIIDVFFNDLIMPLGDLFDFSRALLSLIELFGVVYFLLMLLFGKHIGVKPPPPAQW